MTRILIVDDSPTETFAFTTALKESGYSVLTAVNGEEGVKIALKEKPDLVLMDIVMPELNGFQATRQLTRNPETSHIPVVIVTTKDQETDRVWGARQGAKGYLVKPVNKTLLLSTIEQLLEDR